MTAPPPAPTYLTETSAVLPALGISTEDHCRHYEETVAGGVRKSSVYVRKEFIAACVCELIDVAIEISLSHSVSDAFTQLSQRFGNRTHKIDVVAMGILLESQKAMGSTQAAMEEVGRLAVAWLKTFDRVFKSLVPNATGCKIGSNRLRVDYNRLLEDLRKFLITFREDVKECSINTLVRIGQPTQRAQVLIEGAKTGKLDSVKSLVKLIEANAAFSCKSCRKIGDAAIALEQPADVCLIHLDKSFLHLCPALEREHLQILSVDAIKKRVRAMQSESA